MSSKYKIPSDPAQMPAFLDTIGRDNLGADDYADVAAVYAKQWESRETELAEKAREIAATEIQNMLKENKATAGPVNNGTDPRSTSPQGRKQGLYNKSAMGHSADGMFNSFGELLRSTAGKAHNFRDGRELMDKRNKLQDIQNAFGTNSPSDGGFLVPEEFRSDIITLALESSIIRPRATVIPMSSQRTIIPINDSTSNQTTNLGGFTYYWVDEGTAPTETSAKFGQIVLDAKKLMAYTSAPNELVADGVGFDAWLRQWFPRGLAFKEDYAFLNGTGAGEPLGLINCAAAVITTAQSGQGANTIVVENLANMYARMLPSSLSNAVWLVTQDAFAQLATMALSVGTGGSAVWLAGGGVADAPPMSIYGRPVIMSEKLPGLGTTGDICFADLSYYAIGDRQQMSVSESTDFLFSTDKTAYKIVERVDGRPLINSAMTQANGSTNTLSPFVQLSSTRT